MQLEFDPSTNERKAPKVFVVVNVDNARILLSNLLSSEIKKDDVPLSARQHFLSALYEVWCMERRDLAKFGEEEQSLLNLAIENHELLEGTP